MNPLPLVVQPSGHDARLRWLLPSACALRLLPLQHGGYVHGVLQERFHLRCALCVLRLGVAKWRALHRFDDGVLLAIRSDAHPVLLNAFQLEHLSEQVR